MPQGRWSHRPPWIFPQRPPSRPPFPKGNHLPRPLTDPQALSPPAVPNQHRGDPSVLVGTALTAVPIPSASPPPAPVPASPGRFTLPPPPSDGDRPGRVEVSRRGFPQGTLPFPPGWPQGSPGPSPHPSGDCKAAPCAALSQLLLRSQWELSPHHPSKPGVHHPLPMGV